MAEYPKPGPEMDIPDFLKRNPDNSVRKNESTAVEKERASDPSTDAGASTSKPTGKDK